MSPTRTDKNQQIIIDTFIKLGYKVRDTSAIGQGFPGLIICRTGENILVECQTETAMLTTDQIKFISDWNSAVYICRDADDCVQLDQGLLAPVTLTNEHYKQILGV